jgi:hypothetical protein
MPFQIETNALLCCQKHSLIDRVDFGSVAEWLRRGLQILVWGFDSLRNLQRFLAAHRARKFFTCEAKVAPIKQTKKTASLIEREAL